MAPVRRSSWISMGRLRRDLGSGPAKPQEGTWARSRRPTSVRRHRLRARDGLHLVCLRREMAGDGRHPLEGWPKSSFQEDLARRIVFSDRAGYSLFGGFGYASSGPTALK